MAHLKLHFNKLTLGLIFMNVRSLFFCIACCITLNNHRPLLACDNVENVASMPANCVNGNLIELANNICDLLMHGHLSDEVIAMFNDNQKYPYDIEKLVMHIQDLLKKQHSKGVIINIIEDNKEAKEYYAQMLEQSDKFL